MRKVSALWACVVLLGACGGGTSGNVIPSATATPVRAVATLAAPLGTMAIASAAAVTAAAATSAAPSATSSAAASAGATASTPPASQVPAATAAAAATSAVTPAPAATVAATAAPATPAPSAAAAFSGVIHVTLLDTAIKLDQTSMPAGPVTFSITNSGYVPHDLVVLQTSIPQDQLPLSPTNPKQVQEPGLAGQAMNIAVGASANLVLTLGAGPYVLICNMDNHYKNGMHTGLTVTGS